ncbi:MAG: MmcQ/YjbR family DNA-binding protein [Actinobacteria bacterium]|nr:MmcQ/YjbR family DNA-binding protein [Actinomycetota bacterium]
MSKADATERVRRLCLALPETSERLSHGTPSFFVQEKRCFLMLWDNHHGDGIFGFWSAAPPGNQELLIEADPERFFRPPYVGHRGWLGVRLDRAVDWDEIAGIVEDAWATVAPKKVLASLDIDADRDDAC